MARILFRQGQRVRLVFELVSHHSFTGETQDWGPRVATNIEHEIIAESCNGPLDVGSETVRQHLESS